LGLPQWWYSIWLPIVCTGIGLRAVGLFIRRSRATPDTATDAQA
ncbi:UNVERIFIED_CONTAM: TRAP transporter small permease, partial [Salmonella enterica subsp. enterica serovar Weltevreden]